MNIISTIIGSVFEIYTGHMFFSKFGIKKISDKTYIACLFAFAVGLIISSLTLVQSGLIFLVFTIYSFLHCSLFDIKLLKKIVLTFILVIVDALAEMIVVLGTTIDKDTNITNLQDSDIMYLVCILIAKFLAFSILKPIRKPVALSQSNSPLWFKLGTAALPLTSTFIIILLYRYSYIVTDTKFQIGTLIAAGLIIISNLLILFIIDKQETYYRTSERLQFAEQHIKNQVSHYSELYSQQESLKKFRHDIKNYYTSLISILESSSVQDAIDYIKNKMQIESFDTNTINSGHPVIDAIINSKSQYAQGLGISIESIIKITTKIYIDELELGVLIGNALDNAIEAVEKLDDQTSKTINLNIFSSGDMLSIEASNPTVNNIDTDNLKSTKKDKLIHGYGLAGIESITNKHSGKLTITCQNNIFTLSCILVNINK